MRFVECLLFLALPEHARESVLGDLIEERKSTSAQGGLRTIMRALRIALHYQVAPYREGEHRLGIVMAATSSIGLLWLVSATGWSSPDPSIYHDPLSRLALEFWNTSHVTSALAAGLLAGHAPLIPHHASPARKHLCLVLATLAFTNAGAGTAGLMAASTVATAAWFGDRARSPRLV